MTTLGIGKTNFNSSVALLGNSSGPIIEDIEIFLTERHDHIKISGAWPYLGLKYFTPQVDNCLYIAENRDVNHPNEHEQALDINFPFFQHLRSQKLDCFSHHFNQTIHFLPHHLSHAYAAVAFSPFEECLILVLDGGGSRHKNLAEYQDEYKFYSSDEEANEYFSLYHFKNGTLSCIQKKFQSFHQRNNGEWISTGIGSFYEKMANFVFDSPEAEGKLMGLAAYSPSLPKLQTTLNHFDFLKSIDLTKSASMQKYKTWEENPNKDYYLQLARFTQDYFEQNIFNFLNEAKQKFPNIDNLILTGGCALNCTANAKILHSKLFNHIYVTPNPSDTSISLGCAYGISQIKEERIWSPLQHQHQIAYLGAKSSVPENYNILKLFQDFEIEQCFDICKFTATLLAQNKIIAWFQGRSECGPRALGNRSILAIPTIPNLRDYLNNKIKFRESFRPYGCSVPWEDSHLYFECSPGFNNPFMSFATPLRSSFQDILKEVAHVDNTSRMQTVRKEQNLLFHTLLKEIQILTNIPILLNTSLNVMNEPILETPIDALRFLKNSTIDGLAIGNFYIYNKKK